MRQPYLGDYLYMMAVGTSFYGIFSANNTPDNGNFPNGVTYQRNADFATKTLLAGDNVTQVRASIDPFFFKVAPKTGKVVTAIANAGNFGEVCLGSFTDEELTIDNGGEGPLSITGITSSSPDFLPPGVLSYPIKLGAGDSVEVAIRFKPTSVGAKTATITIVSDDPAGPHHVRVSGVAPTPRLSLLIANGGDLGKVCTGAFADGPLILNNSGHCPVSVSGIASSSPDFLVPQVLSLPLLIDPGGSLTVPVRFAPGSLGAKSATITVTSSDPSSPHTITVSGEAPPGKLAVTGSLCFGGVKACCRAERTISICNVGECALHVASVAFKRKNKHWKLVNNPFPATSRSRLVPERRSPLPSDREGPDRLRAGHHQRRSHDPSQDARRYGLHHLERVRLPAALRQVPRMRLQLPARLLWRGPSRRLLQRRGRRGQALEIGRTNRLNDRRHMDSLAEHPSSRQPMADRP